MKASEMTNKELAKNAEEFANAFHNDSDKAILREAAARLRALSALTTRTDNSEVIAELQRRLKIAEDALEKIAKDDFCEHGEMAARALYDIRAIREEAKP